MKVFYSAGCVFFICLLAVQGCSRTGQENASPDPFRGLSVIETASPLDINDRDSLSMGQFFIRSKYFEDMAISKEGEYFVSNDNKILHFDEKGQFLAQIGREGKGPGEFLTSPLIDVKYNDTLFALDTRPRMVSIFVNREEGWSYSGSFNLEKREKFEPEDIFHLNEDRLAVEQVPYFRRLINEDDESTLLKTIDIVSIEGKTLRESLLVFPESRHGVYTGSGGASVITDLPFGYRSIIRPGPDQSFYHIMTNDFLIKIYGSEGRTIDKIRYPNYSIKISEDKRRSTIEEEVKVSFGSDIEDRAMKEHMVEQMPDSLHPLNDMHVDRDTGHIIVRRSELFEGPNWLLLDSLGNRLGTFSLNKAYEVFDFRDGKIIGALIRNDDAALPTIRIVSLSDDYLD